MLRLAKNITSVLLGLAAAEYVLSWGWNVVVGLLVGLLVVYLFHLAIFALTDYKRSEG